MITEEERRSLEEAGYKVIFESNLSEIRRYNTNVFVLYNGEKVPYYSSLSQIPPLQNGQTFMLAARALPKEVREWDRVETYLHKFRGAGLPVWWVWVIGLAILTVLTGIVLLGIYNIVKAQDTRCGTTAEIKDISECMKIIVAPDCSIRTYNACEEKWSDEEWHEPTPPTPPSTEWLKWIAIIILLGGGTYIAIKYGPTIAKKVSEALKKKEVSEALKKKEVSEALKKKE